VRAALSTVDPVVVASLEFDLISFRDVCGGSDRMITEILEA
jgi:hypothetical protein